VSEINKSAVARRKYCPKCRHIYGATEEVCPQDQSLLQPEPLSFQNNKLETPIGTVLADRYEILSEVGRGGMSIVYEARHLLMDKVRAIKMLLSQLMYDQTSKKRFQREAEAASCLDHPNIIAVHDFGIAPTGQPYLVMDFLVGESLAELIKREQRIEQFRAVKIFLQTCDALSHAHKKGVIHRDLKSSNIMLVQDDETTDIVKVLDFGIAKLMPASGKFPQNLTQTGEVFGSPIYMSPEQCLGQTLDERSDIYSMGTMFYEALVGVPPLVGNTIVDTMQMHVATKPASFSASGVEIFPRLEALVFKALEKKPDERFQSMEEMFHALVETYVLMGGAPFSKAAIDHGVYMQESTKKFTVAESGPSVNQIKSIPSISQLNQQAESLPVRQSLIDNKGLILTVIVGLILIIVLLMFIIYRH
jgi:eukaryotic-like serine/threonine-protein kinase